MKVSAFCIVCAAFGDAQTEEGTFMLVNGKYRVFWRKHKA
jgi:hypothetical protein